MTLACRLSVVCLLLSVTSLNPKQRLELFGNIFAPPNSSGTRTVCTKILGKKSKGFYGLVQIKYKGYEKMEFFFDL